MEKFEIVDNDQVVTCRICGERFKRLYGKHFTETHKITSKEYRKMFPGAPIASTKDKKSTSKNSGKHMKLPKYKKMFAEKIMGKKNPNHKSRTTLEERKSRSPFSKEFIGYENLDDKEKEEVITNLAREVADNRLTTTQLEYYIEKGYSKEEAVEMLSQRQTTFSLDICIEKHGEEEGLKVWKDRQEKWQKSLIENGNIKCGYSKISQELFDEIIKFYDGNLDEVYYATKNKEYFISVKEVGFFCYDFVDLNSMKIIEYNGDVYHANPDMYNESDKHHPYYGEDGPTAKETWERDKLKLDLAKDCGFETLVIWDSEYKSDKKIILEKCLSFLNKNKE